MKNDFVWSGETICSKCHRPKVYVGDIPDGGFKVGSEPYCVCGTHICKCCGQRAKDNDQQQN